MNYKWIGMAVMGVLCVVVVRAQKDQGYQVLRMTSAHTCFPDTGRAKGWLDGDSVFRTVAGHYDDSSVLLVVPSGLKREREVDLIFWFHGWHNNIDTALQFYGLARQFAASGREAVLVLPEAAKNAADSYSGKLRQRGDFRALVGDVVDELKRKGIVAGNAVAGHIALGCHSGGYSAVADILGNGGVPVDEVFLFDALYGRVPVFLDWIKADKRHHFVHWFTNHGGGTDEVSDTLMSQLKARRIDYLLTDEGSLTSEQIREHGVLFVHSPREHNVIINDPDDFRMLLENSSVFLTKR
jgi:hypothetical protein